MYLGRVRTDGASWPVVSEINKKFEVIGCAAKTIIDLAITPASKEAALAAMERVNQGVIDRTKVRRILSEKRGEGFQSVIISKEVDGKIRECRIVYYGAGEYVQPHYHDINEKFIISEGGCHVWMSQDEGRNWEYHYCDKELVIPDGAWHCLVADEAGLCMHVYDDTGRSINWLTKDRDSQWSEQAVYETTIQELREGTKIQ